MSILNMAFQSQISWSFITFFNDNILFRVLIERTKLMNDELKNEGYSYQVQWEPENFGIGRRL